MNQFFSTIKKIVSGILSIGIALGTIMKIGFRKPVTLEYPEKKKVLNERFRGKLNLRRDENGNLTCIGCETCIRACPGKGILKVKKEKSDDGKFRVTQFDINIGQCIFCGNCEYVCPGNHIFMTKEYELATGNKEDLMSINFNNKEVS